MADSTAKSEAMQALRLLYVAAHGGGSSDHKNPEMLYRARVLLEQFIERTALEPNAIWTPMDRPITPEIANGFYMWDQIRIYKDGEPGWIIGANTATNTAILRFGNVVNGNILEMPFEAVIFEQHGALK